MPSTRIVLIGGILAMSMLAAPAPNAAAPPAGTNIAPAAAATAAARAIDAYVAPMLNRGHLSGQLLVLRGGRVIVERSWGKANAELGVAVTPETRFNIASVTKPMTGVVAVQMIEEGRIGAEDSIARWIPNFPKGDSIRVS